MEPVFFKAPEFDEVANYPLRCREAFLEQTARLSMASPSLRAYFVLPKINQILDDYNTWLAVYGD